MKEGETLECSCVGLGVCMQISLLYVRADTCVNSSTQAGKVDKFHGRWYLYFLRKSTPLYLKDLAACDAICEFFIENIFTRFQLFLFMWFFGLLNGDRGVPVI